MGSCAILRDGLDIKYGAGVGLPDRTRQRGSGCRVIALRKFQERPASNENGRVPKPIGRKLGHSKLVVSGRSTACSPIRISYPRDRNKLIVDGG